MYARVTILQLQPGKTDELIHIFQDSVVPALQQQAGFVSMTLLTDASTDKVMSVGLWQTEADLLASERSGFYQEQLAKAKVLMAAPPVRETYQVSVQV